MVKNNANLTAGPQGVRRRRNRPPQMQNVGSDASIITYTGLGAPLANSALGGNANFRLFTGGNNSGFQVQYPGPQMVKFYSTCRFLPGTTIRWEPQIGSTSSGRVHACFIDNPEKLLQYLNIFEAHIAAPTSTTLTDCINAVRTTANSISFPAWMEREIPFPQHMRRKEFSTDLVIDLTGSTAVNANSIDRSVQQGFFYVIEASDAPGGYGSMWFHDRVMAQGISALSS